jgi:cephalosporin hydroxylase
VTDFEERNRRLTAAMAGDEEVRRLTRAWFDQVSRFEYSYHFTWLGLPIIQFPQDILAVQEVVWRVRPDLIVETGIARGGSLVLSASLLELIGGDGRVVGIDVDIRAPNRAAIEAHPLARRITMIEGSSTDDAVVAQVREAAADRSRVLVMLDSNHTHDHVLAELRRYGPLVTPGSYLIVFDTVIEYMPEDAFPDRPWSRGDNPATAVKAFLAEDDRFVVDEAIDRKLQISVSPGGYLRRLPDRTR